MHGDKTNLTERSYQCLYNKVGRNQSAITRRPVKESMTMQAQQTVEQTSHLP